MLLKAKITPITELRMREARKQVRKGVTCEFCNKPAVGISNQNRKIYFNCEDHIMEFIQ